MMGFAALNLSYCALRRNAFRRRMFQARLATRAYAGNRDAAVAGRLEEYAVAPRRFLERLRVGGLDDVECIKTGAHQEQELVAQHLAGGAQLAAKREALAQNARLAVGAAILVRREHQRDQRKPRQVRLELGDIAAVRPDHADRILAAPELIGIGQETLCRHQDRPFLRDRLAVRNADVPILDNLSSFNEWHRRAP